MLASANFRVYNGSWTGAGQDSVTKQPSYVLGSNNSFKSLADFQTAFVSQAALSGAEGTSINATTYANALKAAGADTLYYAWVDYPASSSRTDHFLTSNDVTSNGSLNTNVYTDAQGNTINARLTIYKVSLSTPTTAAAYTFNGMGNAYNDTDTSVAANAVNFFTGTAALGNADSTKKISTTAKNVTLDYLKQTANNSNSAPSKTYTIDQLGTSTKLTLDKIYDTVNPDSSTNQG
ncbi:hypothetical protein FD12_GL000142 [Lentilactobacillus rapi DSM 19907 = JCM 15042]|uniref:Uncharacterized protein n=1 Tax=Lentilactobacillus rapi DSM 19907 = JCM 15042 TaxID=1423795 RepID=A0ABR5PDE5_9LACO|nr:hypothetical protein FD12_GL000142 [Lentilactobacillus rapi DSM 19907 = JCM 15042]